MTRTLARILAVVACACVFAVCALAGGAPALSTTQTSQPAASTVPADLELVFRARRDFQFLRAGVDIACRGGQH